MALDRYLWRITPLLILFPTAYVVWNCIGRPYWLLNASPFKTSSVLCFLASAIAWIYIGDFANPFTVSLGITGLFYLVAKIIEPEYY